VWRQQIRQGTELNLPGTLRQCLRVQQQWRASVPLQIRHATAIPTIALLIPSKMPVAVCIYSP
jgi:hypothetical protein